MNFGMGLLMGSLLGHKENDDDLVYELERKNDLEKERQNNEEKERNKINYKTIKTNSYINDLGIKIIETTTTTNEGTTIYTEHIENGKIIKTELGKISISPSGRFIYTKI